MFEGAINGLIERIFGESFLVNMSNDLMMIPTDYANTWNTIKSLYNSLFVPFAWCLMLIFFMVHLMDNVSYKELTPEAFFKQFCKLIISAAIVANGINILELFLALGAGLVSSFQSLSGGIGANGQSMVDTMKDFAKTETNNYKLFDSIGFLLQLLIPYACSWIIQVIASVICYSRILELMVKTLFAPIPLCDVFSDSLNHSGSMRYFRSYIATCFQAVVIYAISFVFSQVSADWLTNLTGGSGFGMTIGYLAINLAAVTLIIKSGSLSKELCGVS